MLTSAEIGANADATGADSATFKMTDAKLYLLIVTLSAEDNAKFSKLFGEGFKRPVYWNKYKVIDNKVVEIDAANGESDESDDYTIGCLLDFAYFEKNYKLIAPDLIKQKALDADSRAIQQIIFTGKIKVTEANTRVIIYYILEHTKEKMPEFGKGTTKVL